MEFEKSFIQAWKDTAGDDFASRMARKSLEAIGNQVWDLQPILAELQKADELRAAFESLRGLEDEMDDNYPRADGA